MTRSRAGRPASATEIRVSLDHILEKAIGDNWRFALDADNLRMEFAMPNTYQIFGRFEPALGLPDEDAGDGLRRLDGRVAFVVAAMFVLCVLRLSHVSPFLYYQF